MGLGLKLLLIGMLTVFTILCLVVLIGNLLISLTNKLSPIEKASTKHSAIAEKHIMAVNKAISLISNDQKEIHKIEKL